MKQINQIILVSFGIKWLQDTYLCHFIVIYYKFSS